MSAYSVLLMRKWSFQVTVYSRRVVCIVYIPTWLVINPDNIMYLCASTSATLPPNPCIRDGNFSNAQVLHDRSVEHICIICASAKSPSALILVFHCKRQMYIVWLNTQLGRSALLAPCSLKKQTSFPKTTPQYLRYQVFAGVLSVCVCIQPGLRSYQRN